MGRRAIAPTTRAQPQRVPLGTVRRTRHQFDYLRPYKGYGTIRITNNDANAIYNGLQLGLTKRYSKGITYGLAYTLSKSMDDGSAQRDIMPNPFSTAMLWGPSDYVAGMYS